MVHKKKNRLLSKLILAKKSKKKPPSTGGDVTIQSQNRKKSNIVSGIIRMHPRGFGFVVPHKTSPVKEDIFIPQKKTLSAVEGDEVEVRYYQGLSAKGIEGEVLSILKRSRNHMAGTLVEKRGKQWLAHVPLLGPGREMIVTAPPDAQVGARMIFEVTHWEAPPRGLVKGKAISFLGDINDGRSDIQAAVEEFELTNVFSNKVHEELASFKKRLSSKEIESREDFSELETFTIDPDESKDFDDALSLTTSKKGYTLYVHIADVSHYVKPHTELDRAALERCNSIYFPGSVLPMLPPALSDDLCSLKPKVKRLTVTVIIELNHEGLIEKYRIVKSVIKSNKRFTYKEAKAVLEGKQKSVHKKTLGLMVEVCHKLKAQRARRGAIEFAMPDLDIKVDEQGNITKMDIVPYDITHQMVEEFMLKANELVAITLSQANKPLTYRIHEEPHPEKMRLFALYANSFGFNLSSQPTSEELQDLFDKTRESSFGKCLITAFIRTMKLASYSTQNIGHYGLMLEHYTHFTSPIRRYIDLIVHRLLFDESDPKLHHETIASQCSEKERSSARAEGSVTYLKKIRYIKTLSEKNPEETFEAIVTSVKPSGLFFEIPTLFIEGMLVPEYFHKKRPKVGMALQVQLINVDLLTRTVEWKLASQRQKQEPKTPSAKSKNKKEYY